VLSVGKKRDVLPKPFPALDDAIVDKLRTLLLHPIPPNPGANLA